jgi:hypothetical protein
MSRGLDRRRNWDNLIILFHGKTVAPRVLDRALSYYEPQLFVSQESLNLQILSVGDKGNGSVLV